MPTTRQRGLAAAAASLVIVVLIVLVLVRIGPGRSPTRSHLAATTPTVAATPTPSAPRLRIGGQWSVVAGLARQPGFPVIAPSDPRVVYEAGLLSVAGADVTSTPQPNLIMRRSDDGGASWHALPAPSLPGNFIAAIALEINPGVASNVFVQAMFASSPNDATVCSLPQAAAPPLGSNPLLGMLTHASKYYGCRLDFYSTDGGEHWSRLALPAAGPWLQSGDPWPPDQVGTDMTQFQAQGTRLYIVIYTGTDGPYPAGLRLLASDDQGATWRYSDATLIRAGQNTCQFIALPTAPIVYATTSADGCFGSSLAARQLWRSDDAGAHWANVGPLTDKRAFLVATGMPSAGQPPLYAVQVGPPDPMTGPLTPLLGDVRASTDGGRTWLPAPRTTIPAGAGIFQFAGTTPAGAILAAVASPTLTLANGGPSTVTLYAWLPGDAGWTQASLPSAATGAPQFIFAATPQSASALWLVTAADQTDPTNQADAVQSFTFASPS